MTNPALVSLVNGKVNVTLITARDQSSAQRETVETAKPSPSLP